MRYDLIRLKTEYNSEHRNKSSLVKQIGKDIILLGLGIILGLPVGGYLYTFYVYPKIETRQEVKIKSKNLEAVAVNNQKDITSR